MRQGHVRSEAEVQHKLVSPLLQRFASSMSSVVAPEGWDVDETPVYSSVLNVETASESRPHTPGDKPRVDYTLVGHAHSQVLYRVPVEVKKNITKDHMKQLSQSMGHLFRQLRMGVGYLINESSLRVAVAHCLAVSSCSPITFISPSIKWREDVTFRHVACIAICLLQQVSMQ